MILGNVIRNCLRQDFISKVRFLRFIKLIGGSQLVLRMTMDLPTFAETKVGRRRHILKLDENSARLRQDNFLATS